MSIRHYLINNHGANNLTQLKNNVNTKKTIKPTSKPILKLKPHLFESITLKYKQYFLCMEYIMAETFNKAYCYRLNTC